MRRAYVFLDRDGTLVADPGYVHRIEDYVLLPGTAEGLAVLQRAGFRLAILTNQSGIGRGYYTQLEFERFQAHLTRDLARHGVEIDASFFCPHLPTAGCGCRKPRTGLLDQARAELGADLDASWLIGDSDADMGLAQAARLRSVRIRAAATELPANPDAVLACRAGASTPTYEARDVRDAASLILSHEHEPPRSDEP